MQVYWIQWSINTKPYETTLGHSFKQCSLAVCLLWAGYGLAIGWLLAGYQLVIVWLLAGYIDYQLAIGGPWAWSWGWSLPPAGYGLAISWLLAIYWLAINWYGPKALHFKTQSYTGTTMYQSCTWLRAMLWTVVCSWEFWLLPGYRLAIVPNQYISRHRHILLCTKVVHGISAVLFY